MPEPAPHHCPARARPADWTTALLTLGATARVVRLIAKDDFPFAALRDWALTRYGEHGWLTRLLECPWCVGVWVAAPATASAALWGHRPWWRALAGWMALSMAASSAVVLTHSAPQEVILTPDPEPDPGAEGEDVDPRTRPAPTDAEPAPGLGAD